MPEDFSNERPADFLVIGAMKCGTTTLYHDLRAQPSVFLPDKESNFLLGNSGDFSMASSNQTCGEVCPDYAKLPLISDIADLACQSSTATKMIYLVRHPVERAISHHHFISSLRAPQNPGMSRNFEEALEKFPELIDFGRYGFQLEPWIRNFTTEQIQVIRFEDFISDRKTAFELIFEFLDAKFDPDFFEDGSAKNASENRPVLNSFWKRVRENPIYRKMIRPFTNLEIRDKVRNRILPKSGARPDPPLPETLEKMSEVFRPDLETLRGQLGHEKPLWDL